MSLSLSPSFFSTPFSRVLSGIILASAIAEFAMPIPGNLSLRCSSTAGPGTSSETCSSCTCSDEIWSAFLGNDIFFIFIWRERSGENLGLFSSGGVAAVLVAYATILPELELTAMMFLILPIRLKTKHLAYGAFALALLLVCFDRRGTVVHSAYLGGCATGWFYAHLLGFGRPSFLQRLLRQHRTEAERYEQMSIEQLMTEEIDPLLEKISRKGFVSLTKSERRSLGRARDKILRRGREN